MLPLDNPCDEDYEGHPSNVVNETEYKEHCLILGIQPNVKGFHDIIRCKATQMGNSSTHLLIVDSSRDTTPTGNPFHEHVQLKDNKWTTIQCCNPLPNLQRIPTKQINTLSTIGNTYADKTRKRTNPMTPPTEMVAPTTSEIKAYNEAQLRNTWTTKAAIISNAKAVFNVTLSTMLIKPELIRNYLNLVGMTNPTPSTTTSTLPDNPTCPCPKKVSSDWNIQQLQGTGSIEFRKPFNGNTYTMIKAIESSLHQHTGEPKPPITILSGWWWSPLLSNFTLTLAGRPPVELVHKYREAILKPFGPNIFDLLPAEGEMCVVFQGIPIVCKSNGNLLTPTELTIELACNIPYKSCGIIEPPRWSNATHTTLDCSTGTFSILLSDPNRTLIETIRKPVYMFGARANPSFGTWFITFKQCSRCHILSHSTEECKHPVNYLCCHICGYTKHTAKDHAHNCPNKKKHSSGLYCNCPLKCINCVYAGKSGNGHLAINDNCPLKKNMQHFRPTPTTTPTNRTQSPQDINTSETPAPWVDDN
jgi:hypothetical protein